MTERSEGIISGNIGGNISPDIRQGTAQVISVDARTGATLLEVGVESPAEEVARITAAAAEAAPLLQGIGRDERARLLEAVAAELEAVGPELIATADAESALGVGRLTGELARTTFQFRFFAEVIRDGAYLDVTIDHADPGASPAPLPDLRRMLVPVGPVAVFGASNFPLAFSVPGGDTASALAAGSPVVVKAHPAHPATSELAAAAIRRALPEGTFALVHGYEAGRALVLDPHIRAVGFTGSERGGRALADLAAARLDPIPFYGELGSVNPLVVTPGAAAARAEEVGRGSADSFMLGVGQFCTKPGLIFVPRGDAGERVVAALVGRAGEIAPGFLLTSGIKDAYLAGARRALDEAPALFEGQGDGVATGATIVRVSASDVMDGKAPLEEVFGPFAVVVDYDGDEDLLAALAALRPALVATVHAQDDETGLGARLVGAFTDRVGRIVWNGYPTGVAVAWAMTHGGPYPATTSPGHTSVGAGAIHRWLRPVSYQSVPEALLPADLRDSSPVPRRVDGRPVL